MKRVRRAGWAALLGAFLLGWVAANYLSPSSVKAQQADFEYVKPMGVSSTGSGVFLFDSRTGQMWLYSFDTGLAQSLGRIQELGSPLTR